MRQLSFVRRIVIFYVLFNLTAVQIFCLAPESKSEAFNQHVLLELTNLPENPSLFDFFSLSVLSQIEILSLKIGDVLGKEAETKARKFLSKNGPLIETPQSIKDALLPRLKNSPVYIPLESPVFLNFSKLLSEINCTPEKFENQILSKQKIIFWNPENQKNKYAKKIVRTHPWLELKICEDIPSKDDLRNSIFIAIHSPYNSKPFSDKLKMIEKQVLPDTEYIFKVEDNFCTPVSFSKKKHSLILEDKQSDSDMEKEGIPLTSHIRFMWKDWKDHSEDNMARIINSVTCMTTMKHLEEKHSQFYMPDYLNTDYENESFKKILKGYREFLNPQFFRILNEYGILHDPAMANLYEMMKNWKYPISLDESDENRIQRALDSLVGRLISIVDMIFIFEFYLRDKNISHCQLFSNQMGNFELPFYFYQRRMNGADLSVLKGNPLKDTRVTDFFKTMEIENFLIQFDKPEKFSPDMLCIPYTLTLNTSVDRRQKFMKAIEGQADSLTEKGSVHIKFSKEMKDDPFINFLELKYKQPLRWYDMFEHHPLARQFFPDRMRIIELSKNDFNEALKQFNELLEKSIRSVPGTFSPEKIEEELPEDPYYILTDHHGYTAKIIETLKTRCEQEGKNPHFILNHDFLSEDDASLCQIAGISDITEIEKWSEGSLDNIPDPPQEMECVLGTNEALFITIMMGTTEHQQAFKCIMEGTNGPNVFCLRHFIKNKKVENWIRNLSDINFNKIKEIIEKANNEKISAEEKEIVIKVWKKLTSEYNDELILEFRKTPLFKGLYRWLRKRHLTYHMPVLGYPVTSDLAQFANEKYFKDPYISRHDMIIQYEKLLSYPNQNNTDFLFNNPDMFLFLELSQELLTPTKPSDLSGSYDTELILSREGSLAIPENFDFLKTFFLKISNDGFKNSVSDEERSGIRCLEGRNLYAIQVKDDSIIKESLDGYSKIVDKTMQEYLRNLHIRNNLMNEIRHPKQKKPLLFSRSS